MNKKHTNKKKIAIIGIGGIGARHLESCANLSFDDYEIYAVDVNCELLQELQKKLNRNNIYYVNSIDHLPSFVDIVIVATQANVRASIIRQLLAQVKVKSLVLEKVLFQSIDDYTEIMKMLKKYTIQAFVNCPRRMWSAYRELKKILEKQVISSISISGKDWDLGCNAIHYIDLIGFLSKSNVYEITNFKFSDTVEFSKRKGNVFISGELSGFFNKTLFFDLSSIDGFSNSKAIKITLENGLEIEIKEAASLVTILEPAKKSQTFNIPFQSELTEDLVLNLIATNTCELSTYEESMNLHLPIIRVFFTYLKKILPDIVVCPIT